MKLKIKPVSVDEADPFLHDALNREECAEILTQLISNIRRTLGPWKNYIHEHAQAVSH